MRKGERQRREDELQVAGQLVQATDPGATVTLLGINWYHRGKACFANKGGNTISRPFIELFGEGTTFFTQRVALQGVRAATRRRRLRAERRGPPAYPLHFR